MKLWRQKKSNGSASSNSGPSKHSEKQLSNKNIESNCTTTPSLTLSNVDRAMSPVQSEDSGLAPERDTTYAVLTLPRENALTLGIKFIERSDLSYPPVIATLSPLGHAADFLAPGDRIHQIDGVSTIGISNQQIMSMLCLGSTASKTGIDPDHAIVEIEFSLPEYISQNSVTTKLSRLMVERENGCLGLTLRGGGDFPLIVTHVRPHGPVYKTGRIKPGDRLLRVDNISMIGKTLTEAQQIIKCDGHVAGYTNLTIEYDVSLVQNVELSMGPLLIEIERPMNDKLGLELCNYVTPSGVDLTSSNRNIDDLNPMGIYIANILPASIADRCGALSVGDKVLSIDNIAIEHTNYTPDEVMTILDTFTESGYTQIKIMPANALARCGHTAFGSPKYSFNTLELRNLMRQRQQSFVRNSALPKNNSVNGANITSPCPEMSVLCNVSNTLNTCGSGNVRARTSGSGSCSGSGSGSSVVVTPHHSSSIGPYHSESFPVILDCSQGSGIILGAESNCGRTLTIAEVITDSVADRSGCIQKGDRIIAINKMYNLDIRTMRQIIDSKNTNNGSICLNDRTQVTNSANWLELEIEFDMPNAIETSSGVFNVKFMRSGKASLGLKVSGSSHGGLIIVDVKLGSPAHRTGSIRIGDILLAVNNRSVQHFNIDSLLKDCINCDFTILQIKRIMLPDYMFDVQQKIPENHIYSNCPTSLSDHELYNSTYVASKHAGHNFNDCISMKSLTLQPDLNCGASMDDIYFQSVQVRHHETPNIRTAPTRSMMPQNDTFRAHNMQVFTTEPTEEQENENWLCESEMNQQQKQQHQRSNDIVGYDMIRTSGNCNDLPPPMENKVYALAENSSCKNNDNNSNQFVFTVRLEPKGGLLGITLAGSKDIKKPIKISGIIEGGIAHRNGEIQVGDQLLAIDEHSVQGMPVSEAIHLLQNLGDVVNLKMTRKRGVVESSNSGNIGCSNLPQLDAIYAKVQRRPRNHLLDEVGGSSNGEKNVNNKESIIHVTLYKDKVYDDYGFSVSDGLYERGVFINRIRTGGPGEICGMLKPFDRIIQINEMKTQDFDCCLTVPLIAAAGDKIEMIIQRAES